MQHSKLTRPRVTCHMNVSIDGKIDGEFVEAQHNAAIGNYYVDALRDIAQAWANGSTTHKMYFEDPTIDLKSYEGRAVTFDDKIFHKEAPFTITFDTHGKMMWPEAFLEYPSGIQNHVIEVLTNDVSEAYIAYLDEKRISRIFAGEKKIDLPLALHKLRTLAGITEMIVSGGATINGAFFEARLVDRISLVMAPSIDGHRHHKTIADIAPTSELSDQWKLLFAKVVDENGLHLMWEKR